MRMHMPSLHFPISFIYFLTGMNGREHIEMLPMIRLGLKQLHNT